MAELIFTLVIFGAILGLGAIFAKFPKLWKKINDIWDDNEYYEDELKRKSK